MDNDRTYTLRDRFSDGIPRAAFGIFIDLTKHQVEMLEVMAKGAGKSSLKEYLTDLGYAAIEAMVPSVAPTPRF